MLQLPIKPNFTEKGQTVLAVVLVMVIALAVGISASSRFVKNLRTISTADSTDRAVAVAEAAIERILTIPDETLLEYIELGTCGSNCYLEIPGDDGVDAIATVVLSDEGAGTDPLPIQISTTSVTEINLLSYPDDSDISVCWDNPAVGELPSISGMFIYGSLGDYTADSYAVNSIGSPYGDNGFDDAISNHGYAHCFNVVGRSNPQVLRLHSFYNDFEAFVVPALNQSLPSQGIRIESTGQVDEAIRKVVVVKSAPFLPLQFDYVLFQKSLTEPLSN